MEKSALDKIFNSVEKEIKSVTMVAPVAVTFYQGKRFKFKTKPLTVIEYTEKMLRWTFLSDNQKFVLREIWGDDPEEWRRDANEIVMLIGQRGGKNVIAEISTGYAIYFIGNLFPDPYEAFEYYTGKQLQRTMHFEITNNSMVSESQAKTVFFDRIKTVLRAAKTEDGDNWYKIYMGLDLAEEGLGDIKAKTIFFPSFSDDTGQVRLHSLDSGYTTPEGKGILLGFLDEPSRADTQTTYENAYKLYNVVNGNTSSTFPNCVGKTISFSYPNTSEYDLTYELYEKEQERIRKAKEDNKEYHSTIRCFKFSTYDFNPSIKKTDPDKIRKYEDNLTDAMARFECMKSRSEYSFFQPYIFKIKECVIPGLQNRVTTEQWVSSRTLKDGTVQRGVALRITDMQPDDKVRVLVADTSTHKDMFVLALGYSEELERQDFYKTSFAVGKDTVEFSIDRRVIFDTILVWTPKPKQGLPIDYVNIGETMDKILEMFPNIMLFAGDRFETASLAAKCNMKGIKAETFVFSQAIQYEYYSKLKVAVFNKMVGYINHPIAIEELERVQKMGSSDTKIDHPKGFHKDVADAFAIGYAMLMKMDLDPVGSEGLATGAAESYLMELINKLIVCENEAQYIGLDKKKYAMEKMFLSEEKYNELKEVQPMFFPDV